MTLVVIGAARLAQASPDTTFTYQGGLKLASAAVTGTADFEFTLWDAANFGGNQIGSMVPANDVPITDGLFSVELDFGVGVFTGDARWLEIAVRAPAGSGSFTTLDPRQPLNAAPRALALPGLYTVPDLSSPSVIGGYSGNVVSPGQVGGTISGGGDAAMPNQVTGHYGTVGGGGNLAGNYGGITTDAAYATVGGGLGNAARGEVSTISGGRDNRATGLGSTVPGGTYNVASGDYSFAAGRRAKVDAAHNGAFVWADSTDADFASIAPDTFNVRAANGPQFFANGGNAAITLRRSCMANPRRRAWNTPARARRPSAPLLPTCALCVATQTERWLQSRDRQGATRAATSKQNRDR